MKQDIKIYYITQKSIVYSEIFEDNDHVHENEEFAEHTSNYWPLRQETL